MEKINFLNNNFMYGNSFSVDLILEGDQEKRISAVSNEMFCPESSHCFLPTQSKILQDKNINQFNTQEKVIKRKRSEGSENFAILPDVKKKNGKVSTGISKMDTLTDGDWQEIVRLLSKGAIANTDQLDRGSSEKVFQEMCHIFEKLFSFPEPISEKKIEIMHAVLSQSCLIKEKTKALKDKNSICTIIYELHRCYKNSQKYGSILEIINKADKISFCQIPEGEHLTESTMILEGINQKWVFKPMRPKNFKGATTILPEAQCIREHVAHLLNDHGGFPIPLTTYVIYKGEKVTVQRYIDGPQGLFEIEKTQSSHSSEMETSNSLLLLSEEYQPINQEKLQRLLVFDLLFSNGDRHASNIMFEKIAEEYHVVGIDHGDCMVVNDYLKIDYLGLLNHSFLENLGELVNEENEKKYEKIMKQHGIENDPILWMGFVCKCMRYILSGVKKDTLTAGEIGTILIKLHRSKKWGVELFKASVEVFHTDHGLKGFIPNKIKIH